MQKTILIVEDQPELIRLLRLTLQPLGHRMLDARDGPAALALCERERPDLVLLDAMLPGGIDGFEICRRIRIDARLERTLVVMLTARGQQVDIEEGRRVGADRYVVKPYRPSELLDQVAKLVGDASAKEMERVKGIEPSS